MAQSSKLLDHAVVQIAEQELKKLGSYGYVSMKLNAVIAAHKHGITAVAKVYDISRTTLTEWIKHIKTLAIQKLTTPARNTTTKLNDEQKELVARWIAADPNLTIKALRLQIEEQMGIILAKSTVHRLIQKLGYAYITPRPVHHKQNKETHEVFKKKSK